MKQQLNEAKKLFQQYKFEDARKMFEHILEDDTINIEALLFLGRIQSKMQDYGSALNYYNRVISIEPDNKEAKTGIKLVKNILQLTNTFYFENAYTDDDLYDFDS